MRKTFLNCLIFVGLVFCPAHAGSTTPAATVNGRQLLAWEVERELSALVTGGGFHKNIPAERRAELERQAIETLVLKELKRQWTAQMGIRVDQVAVEASVAEVRARFADEEVFQSALEQKGIFDAASFRRAFERDAAAVAVDERVRSQVAEPSAIEVEIYYILNRDEYVRPEARHIIHVLLPVPPQADSGQWDRTALQAEQLAVQVSTTGSSLLEAGANLIEGISPRFRDQVGDLGFVHRGTLHPDLDREVFAVEPGEVTAPIRTIFGYHVLQVLGVRPPEPLEFEQVRDAIAEALFDQRRAEALADFERAQRDAAEIEVHGWRW